MSVLTFDDIAAIMAEHQRAEAARNAPAVAARRAIDELVDALGCCSAEERNEIRAELMAVADDLDERAELGGRVEMGMGV